MTCVVNGALEPQLYDVPLTIVIVANATTSASAVQAGRALPARIENGGIQVKAAPSTDPLVVKWK
jgi:hypothetical protein